MKFDKEKLNTRNVFFQIFLIWVRKQ
jgi:hypothetical protein